MIAFPEKLKQIQPHFPAGRVIAGIGKLVSPMLLMSSPRIDFLNEAHTGENKALFCNPLAWVYS